MRKKIVVGNWKMNTSIEIALNLVLDINELKGRELESIILVPFTHIKVVQDIACPNLKVGAQNVSQYDCGAYTGEISSTMLESMGVNYVTIGHKWSEGQNFYIHLYISLEYNDRLAFFSAATF